MESKIDATHRLNREGRLQQFNARRDELRQQLKAAGKRRAVAVDESWRTALAEFPPIGVATEDDDLLDLPDEQDQDDVDSQTTVNAEPVTLADLRRDILWVYANLGRKQVARATAPSPGARAMLQWASQNPVPFFDKLLAKVVVREADVPPDENCDDPGLAELEQRIRTLLTR